jgi:hypothetical protein
MPGTCRSPTLYKTFHHALLLDTGEQSPMNNKSREFWFDLSWLKNEEFIPLTTQIWEKS